MIVGKVILIIGLVIFSVSSFITLVINMNVQVPMNDIVSEFPARVRIPIYMIFVGIIFVIIGLIIYLISDPLVLL